MGSKKLRIKNMDKLLVLLMKEDYMKYYLEQILKLLNNLKIIISIH